MRSASRNEGESLVRTAPPSATVKRSRRRPPAPRSQIASAITARAASAAGRSAGASVRPLSRPTAPDAALAAAGGGGAGRGPGGSGSVFEGSEAGAAIGIRPRAAARAWRSRPARRAAPPRPRAAARRAPATQAGCCAPWSTASAPIRRANVGLLVGGGRAVLEQLLESRAPQDRHRQLDVDQLAQVLVLVVPGLVVVRVLDLHGRLDASLHALHRRAHDDEQRPTSTR